MRRGDLEEQRRCGSSSTLLRGAARYFALISYVSGLNAVRELASRALWGPRLTVLAYHRVNDDPADKSCYTLATARFDEQMSYVSRRFRVVGLAEALRMTDEPGTASDALVITFDDGYRDNFTIAAPILRKHGLTACFFLPAGLIGGAAEVRSQAGSDPFSRTSVEQAKTLLDMGFEVGSHTCTHPNLLRVEPQAARREIKASRVELERRLGVPVEFFAYPGGKRGVHYDDALKEIVRAEFRACCATTRGRNSIRNMDVFEIHRICVQSWWSPFHFARELEGMFDFVGGLPLYRLYAGRERRPL